MRLRKITIVLAPLGLGALFCGCNLPYIVHSGLGEARVLARTVPMDRALKNPRLSAPERDKLRWVCRVRDYARDTLGLKTGKSYLGFYDTEGRPAVWNLSASRKDALQPYSWTFPIVGKFDYLGYFDKAAAEDHARRLEKKGYDTVIYGAGAYSTAGWFADPFFSSLLKHDKAALAETVIHELTHNTVFVKNDSNFTESVASFVGRTGSLQFIAATMGEGSDLYKQAINDIEDEKVANEFLAGVYRDLEAFYARKDLSSAQKIAQRDKVFLVHRERFKTQYLPRFHRPEAMKACGELPVNNARILLNRRYNYPSDLFEKVYRACGQDLKEAIGVFAQAAKSKNAWQFLRDWLARSPNS